MISFRSRIRWVTLSLIALLLLIFSVLLYFGLSILLYRHIDTSLLALSKAEVQRVEHETGHLKALDSGRDHDEDDHDDDQFTEHDAHELREAIRSSVVLSPNGTVLWTGEDVVLSSDKSRSLDVRATQGEIVYETIVSHNSPSLRRISFPIMVQGRVDYILQTETSLQFVEDSLTRLLLILGAVAIIILGLAWKGSSRP